MDRKWIVAGALSLGVFAFSSADVAFAKDKDDDNKKPAAKKVAKEPDVDEVVRWKDLPAPVKETVQKERGNHEVKKYWFVRRNGHEFYRVLLDTKGDDTILRVRPGGKLAGEQDVEDESKAKIVEKAKTQKRTVKVFRDESDGEEVEFDRLPGGPKSKIASLAKGDKIEEVIRYKRNGKVFYRAEVGEGKYTRFIRVAESGDVDRITGDEDPGEKVAFDRLPGAPKSKIAALAKSGKVDEVIMYERKGKTYYQAEVDEKGGANRTFFFTVDAEGHEVQGLPRH